MVTTFDTAFTYTITSLFGAPYFTGTSPSSPEVPDKYDVALDGRAFMLDGPPVWRTIPTLRTQSDDREAAELSLNPEGLWRRSSSSWELGAGQVMYDDENSDRQRVRATKGIDVWTQGQATLLPATLLQATVAATAGYVQVESTAEHLYWVDDETLVRSDLTSQANVTGAPASTVTSMVSTGSYILAGYESNGVYKVEGGNTLASPWITDALTPSVVGWAKGRVIVAVGNAIYNPITSFASAGTLPIPLLTHPDSSFQWVGVAEGTSWIFMGGTSGDKSSIYRCIVRSDGTSLDVPTVCGRLPDGEILTSLYGYVGALILGTNRGFRIAEPNGNGDLIIGSLVDLGVSVVSMMGRGTFVYFGWTDYDDTSTGVGRMDLSNLTDGDNLVPAYASDLMADTQGMVAGIGYLNGRIVFGVNGVGVYKDSPTELVTSGTITTGIIRYGITEDKVVTGARPSWTGPGIVTLELATDAGTFASIGDEGAQERGVNFELRATLTQSGSHISPVLESMTLFSYPAPAGTLFIDIPIIIAETVETAKGIEANLDLDETMQFLRDRFRSKVLVALQLGTQAFQVTLEQFRFEADKPATRQRGAYNGVATLALKVIS